MNAAVKLALYGVIVAAVFAGSLAVGAVAGPIDVGGGHDDGHGDGDIELPAESDGSGDSETADATAPGGYELDVASRTVPAEGGLLRFRILDGAGDPVVDFDEVHEAEMHLILVSHTLVDYAHLHPDRDASGEWTVDVPSMPPGGYQVYADFRPTGAADLTLDAFVSVAGRAEPVELPRPSRTASVDEYTVTLSGETTVGETELVLTVERDGNVVHPDPYLGADGHLVAIRGDDLTYLHVHPADGGVRGEVHFGVELPAPGTHRLFFDFAHEGEVRTAAFTVEVDAAGDGETVGDTPASVSDNDGHEGH